MIRTIFFIIVFLSACATGFAQALQNDSASFHAKISLGGSINDGNFQRLGLTNTADVTMNTAKGRFGLLSHNQYNYTKLFGALAENDLLTRTLFYSKLSSRWYAMAIFWYETNELRQIHPLVQGGVGIEYVWLLKKDNMAGISLGITGEHKHFDDDMFSIARYDGSHTINTSRVLLRAHGTNKIGVSRIAFVYDVFYMPSINYSDNYRFHGEASLDIPVMKHLDLHAGFNYNYENVVVNGVKPNDFFTEYGISINF